MISITGKWYDSRTSAQVGAICRIYDDGAVRVERLENGESLVLLPLHDIKASTRLADTSRRLYFPSGEKFETKDNDAVDRVMNRFKHRSLPAIVYRLESRKRYIVLALASLLLFMWGSMKYGVPAAARLIAFRLPPSIHDIAGRHTLDILDRAVFRPSELDKATRTRLMEHFRPVMEDHPANKLEIIFRKGGRIGPNAFALPGGVIIFSDEIVRLAEHDDELLAVLTHEVGHIVHRHAMRRAIQDSLLGFALLAITGDVSGSSELFLGLPVLLTELAYSRQFEREADRYAIDCLCSLGTSPIHFARLMRRIDQKMVSKSKGSGKKWLNYLSTHPMTEERLRNFEQKKRLSRRYTL
ncbi:MAG: M48 family metallopeptidase [Deltaproteobacteria bacterium]|nr:M48 family metallopeptidase [Deltaproteobacteria bacterium]